MTYETILAGKDGPSFVVRLNRPECRNALSLRLMDELSDAARAANADDNARAMILTGGPDYFSAGADLNEVLQIKSPADGSRFFGRWHALCEELEALGKPVIAAIEGFCITGGCELALACDIRVAARGATFSITSSRIGTVAGFGGTQRLPRLVGPAKALEILFSAESVDAEEAHRIGLVNRVVDKGQALAEAKRMAEIYAQRAPLSLAFAKRAVHQGLQTNVGSGLELELSLVTDIYATEDKQEGIRAFLEKRKPSFKGR